MTCCDGNKSRKKKPHLTFESVWQHILLYFGGLLPSHLPARATQLLHQPLQIQKINIKNFNTTQEPLQIAAILQWVIANSRHFAMSHWQYTMTCCNINKNKVKNITKSLVLNLSRNMITVMDCKWLTIQSPWSVMVNQSPSRICNG